MRFCHSSLYVAMFIALPSAQVFSAETRPLQSKFEMNTIVVEADQHRKKSAQQKYNQRTA